jgi:hypothetical protein
VTEKNAIMVKNFTEPKRSFNCILRPVTNWNEENNPHPNLRNYLTFHVEKQHALAGLKLGITCLLTQAFSPIADENIKN